MVDWANKTVTWGDRYWDFGELTESIAESGQELKEIFAESGEELKDIWSELVEGLADCNRQRIEEGTLKSVPLWQAPLALATAPILMLAGAAVDGKGKKTPSSSGKSSTAASAAVNGKNGKSAKSPPSSAKMKNTPPQEEDNAKAEITKCLFVRLCENIAAVEKENGIKIEPEFIQPRFNSYFQMAKEAVR